MPQVSLAELVEKAIANQVISFPTDTVPALAARPEQAALIFATKQRPADKPLILMGADPEDLWDYVAGSAQERGIWRVMAQTYWPGALTLVLPASHRVPAGMNPLDPTTIGVRIPDHGTARQILAQTGCLATTSANLSGQLPLQEMTAIANAFPTVWVLDVTDLPIDERKGSGLPSTVAKWTGEGWHILRQGSV
jgi:L-threonylcarbamoyladenylate synthase